MKKLLSMTLCLAMLVPAAASAELFKNLKVGGQLDVQTTSARNIVNLQTRPDSAPPTIANIANWVGGDDRIGRALSRLMFHADWDLLDDVHTRVTLVKGGTPTYQGILGTHAGNTLGNVRPWGSTADTINNLQATTLVQEAFVKIDKLFADVDATVGRQFYGDPGDLVIYFGPKDNYGLDVSALDVARFDWSNDKLNLTGIAGKISNYSDPSLFGLNDNDIQGLAATLKITDSFNPNVYLYREVQHNFALPAATIFLAPIPQPTPQQVHLPNTNIYVLGIKDKASWGNAYASGELAKNFGDTRGWAILTRGGYKADTNMGLIHPWAELGLGSGSARADTGSQNTTFQSIFTDYRPGGIYGRFDQTAMINLGGQQGFTFNAASNGLSNRFIWGLGVKATPASLNKLTAGLQFYKYAYQRDVSATIVGNNTFLGKNIGSEFDLTAEWKHSENVIAKITLGDFQPGEVVYNAKQFAIQNLGAGVNPAVMAAADLTVRF